MSTIFDELIPPKKKGGLLPLSLQWKGVTNQPVVWLPIKDLSPIDNPKELRYSQVRASVLEKGYLYHPVVVLDITSTEWREYKALVKPNVLSPPSEGRFKVVMCGCNRYAVARDLGYTQIPSIIATGWNNGIELCKHSEKDKQWRRDGTVLPTAK